MAIPDYQLHRSSQAIHRRRYRRRSRLLWVLLLVLLLAAGAFLYSLYRAGRPQARPAGPAYQQSIAGPQVFRSTYFQFSDTAKWQYAANDSTANRFTYLLYVSGVPAHSLTVYVNQQPLDDDLATTRVLPARIKDDNSLLPGDISETCGSHYAASDLKKIRPIDLAGTTMLCVPDSPQYSVMVGQVGGNYNLTLRRQDGQTARYIILYRNLSVSPDPAPFLRVMRSFRAL